MCAKCLSVILALWAGTLQLTFKTNYFHSILRIAHRSIPGVAQEIVEIGKACNVE